MSRRFDSSDEVEEKFQPAPPPRVSGIDGSENVDEKIPLQKTRCIVLRCGKDYGDLAPYILDRLIKKHTSVGEVGGVITIDKKEEQPHYLTYDKDDDNAFAALTRPIDSSTRLKFYILGHCKPGLDKLGATVEGYLLFIVSIIVIASLLENIIKDVSSNKDAFLEISLLGCYAAKDKENPHSIAFAKQLLKVLQARGFTHVLVKAGDGKVNLGPLTFVRGKFCGNKLRFLMREKEFYEINTEKDWVHQVKKTLKKCIQHTKVIQKQKNFGTIFAKNRSNWDGNK